MLILYVINLFYFAGGCGVGRGNSRGMWSLHSADYANMACGFRVNRSVVFVDREAELALEPAFGGVRRAQ